MDPRPSEDYYSLLGIDPGADPAELARAWRRLALRWHPDRAGHGATPIFQLLSAAYAVLSDPVARAAYDRKRSSSAAAPHPSPRSSASARARTPGVLLSRLNGPLNALLACGVVRWAADGVLELVVNAQEAAQGGMVTISMRVAVHCPACRERPSAPCTRCGGQGTVEELFSAWLALAPGVEDGAILQPSVQLPGVVHPVSFRVRHRRAR